MSSWNPKWVKTRRNYNETVIFRLYFNVIIRQYVLSFCLMMTLKYYSFIIVPGLVLTHFLGFQNDILRNMFHFIFFRVETSRNSPESWLWLWLWLWLDDYMTIWLYDYMTIWLYDYMTIWLYDYITI